MVSGQWSVVRKFLRLSAYCLHLTAVLLLTSCATPKAVKPAEKKYISILEKWTRHGKVYENFETKLLLSATFKNEEFREAYIEEYANVYMLDAEKIGELSAEERGAPKRYHEFFLSIHTPIKEWSDLEKKEPIWALYLSNDAGETVSPLEIKRVREKGPAFTRFYPYFDDWSAGYAVKFPLNLSDGKALVSAEARYIKLIITGSPGKGELVWELK